jgi:hypothetical protein
MLVVFGKGFLNESEGAWTTIYTALQPYSELVGAGYYERN